MEETLKKISGMPSLSGFGRPQYGCIVGSTLDKREYKTLSEAQHAAESDPHCTGFTWLPKRKKYKMRSGTIVNTDCKPQDYSYLKINYHMDYDF